MTDDTIAAGGGDRYGQCQRRAEVESRKERVVGQECETTKSTDGLTEKNVCRNVIETDKDLDIYDVTLRECLTDIRRDARDARRRKSGKRHFSESFGGAMSDTQGATTTDHHSLGLFPEPRVAYRRSG